MTTRLLLAVLLFATPLRAASIEQGARDYLTLAAQGRFAELPRAEGAAALETRIRGILRVRCIDTAAIAVRRTAPGVVEAELRDIMPLRLHLSPRGDDWLVSAIEYPDEELASQLIAAKPEERPALYAANRDRLTPDLMRVLYARATALANSRDAAKTPQVARILHEVAIQAGDPGGESLAFAVDSIDARIKRDAPTAMRVSAESIALAEASGDVDILARAWLNRCRIVIMDYSLRHESSAAADAAADECNHNTLRFAERGEEPITLVRALESLALTAKIRGDFFTARRYQEQLRPIAVEFHDRLGEIGYEIQVANIYFDQGDGELALFHHRRALALTRQYDPRRYPYTLIRLGGALVDEGKYAEARELFREALERDEHGAIKLAFNSVSPNMASFVLQKQAIMAAESGALDDAECLIGEAAEIQPPAERFRYEHLLAPYFAKRHDHATALRLSLQSLNGVLFGGIEEVVPPLLSAARAFRGLHDSGRAMDAALEAIARLEAQYLNVSGGSDQQLLAADQIAECYELAAGIALDAGHGVEALAYLEQGRGRVLRQTLENGRAIDPKNETLRREEAELARLNVALTRALGRASNDRAAAKLKAQIAAARLAHQSAVDGAVARAKRITVTERRISPANLPDLLRALPDRMCGVEYFIEDEKLHIFVIRRGQVVVRSVSVGRAALEREVKRYADYVAKNDLRFREPATALYALLIAPIEKDIRGEEALLVIPDKMLWKVSFASLMDARGHFVVERWATVHAPAIAVYGDMLAERRRRAHASPTLLAVGNPTLDAGAAKAFASYYRGANIGALPDAEREVGELRTIYGKSRAKVLRRGEATEERVRSEIGHADVVHFATHALLDDANPMYSRLALARDAGKPDDGWLETWEVARLDVAADLVVLSACETASGRVGGGEGVVGLTWSFFVAGARSTVATEWKVESEATARFMVGFHRALHSEQRPSSLRKARALRTAQLRFLRDPRYRHPFYWAAFVLFGSAS